MKHPHPPCILLVASLLMMAISLSPAASAAKSDKIKLDKVDVCHIPESTSDNRHIINISTNGDALNDHLSHGDWEATAEKCDAIPDNDCDSEPDPAADDANCVAINGGPGWTCQIGVCNSPPTDIALDSAAIDENRAPGTLVGTLSSADPDSLGPFTYTLVSGDGDNENAAFSVAGSQLLSAASFDFESKNSYSIRLMTDAGDGGTYQEAITISVNDINEEPTAIVFENDSIHENQTVGTLISYFTTTDVDANDTHVYTLVAGAGDTDNASFTIVDDRLLSAESFDFETRDSYTVRVRSEDSGGLAIANSYSINIIDVNDPPTAIALDNSAVDEEQAVGTVVGTFSSADVDSVSFVYSLVAGFGDDDNASFSIVGDQLQSAAVFDYDVQDSFDIRVQTDDGDGGTFQETFNVTVVSICGGDCFPNGVAAGDVDQTSVVLWARASYTGTVVLEYGRDRDFLVSPDGSIVIEAQNPPANEDHRIPVKAEISGLIPGTQYFYRACRDSCAPTFSPDTEAKGSFRTPHAAGKNGLRFGVSSCFRGDMKPFFAIKNVPERNLDFFVALGDTVYADSNQAGRNEAGDTQAGNRAKNLKQFRDKHELAYSQLDTPDDNYFALARASTAIYVGIDDHEVVNNFAGGADPASQIDTVECKKDIDLPGDELDVKAWGLCFCDSENDPVENPYEPDHPLYDPAWEPNCDREFINETDLFRGALQAWHEFNPISEERYELNNPPRIAGKPKLYRNRTFGKDAAIFMLDARTFRDEPSIFAYDSTRTMLGHAQLAELKTDLLDAEDNGITWKIVLIPEPIQNLDPVTAEDRFEGYSHERGELLHFIEDKGIANVVFISGDIHGTLVNNLTYKRSLLDPQRFSASWDISAGPAAYADPLGNTITLVGPRPYTDPGDGFGSEVRHQTFDTAFADVFDNVLFLANNPQIGLGPEIFRIPPLQQYNRTVPATPLDGLLSYVATHTYGWTEFEIDANTQDLTVTTYGMDWYDKPSSSGYTEDELAILRNRPQFIVSKFKVAADLEENGSFCARPENCQSGLCDLFLCTAPNSRPALSPCFSGDACKNGSCTFGTCQQICGDGFCDGVEKCGGNDVTGLQCRSDCGQCTNGQICGDDNMCESGLCNAGICTSPQANGSICVRDKGCQSGLCDLGFCTAPRSKARFTPCANDIACVSGNCTPARICGL